MACGSCSKRKRVPPNTRALKSEDYDFTGGMDIRSLNSRQIQARLEVFKRKFCNDCSVRYDCTYAIYLDCKGANPR